MSGGTQQRTVVVAQALTTPCAPSARVDAAALGAVSPPSPPTALTQHEPSSFAEALPATNLSARHVVGVTARAGELAARINTAVQLGHLSVDEAADARACVDALMARVEAAAERALHPMLQQRVDQGTPWSSRLHPSPAVASATTARGDTTQVL